MQTMRVGTAKLSWIFSRNKPARLSLLAFLLALASFSTIFLCGNAQSSSLASAVSSPSQPASVSLTPAKPHPAVAEADLANPNQQIGQLLQMATDLKAEVGKTTQETLSITVVRKAAAIEQLAHKVRTGGNQK